MTLNYARNQLLFQDTHVELRALQPDPGCLQASRSDKIWAVFAAYTPSTTALFQQQGNGELGTI
jgi:hypothetical protein